MKDNNDIKIARTVMRSAIEGIEALSNTLGSNFIELLDTIENIKGKVILSGMGKSGHIAKKISATLSSTGTTSFFVHPAEASHGDLGMITKKDIVILLSNSGETKELTDITNYTRRFGIKLVSIVMNEDSSLAQASDIVIKIPKMPEALEFIAPTTSTTMMLVFGDALALTLLERRGFSKEEFQIFHPGGRLGASFLKVCDIMHMGQELPIVNIDENMKNTIKIMTEKSFGCAIVLDEKNHLQGIITDGNLRRALNKHDDIFNLKAKHIMTSNPITIDSNSLALEALDLMNNRAITSLLILDDNSFVIGILSMHDCLKNGISPN